MNQLDRALQIKNETEIGANSALRVGEAIENVAISSMAVFNIAALKQLDVPAGTYVRVLNHTVDGDGGGGLFVLKNTPEYTNTDFNRDLLAGQTQNIFLLEGTIMEKTTNIGDRVRWAGGVDTEATAIRHVGDTTMFGSLWLNDGAIAGLETGWWMPSMEGLRVIPSFAGAPREVYWDRVLNSDSTIRVEWFGARKSKWRGERSYPNQDYFNYAFNQGYNVMLDAGIYYISDTIKINRHNALLGRGSGGYDKNQTSKQNRHFQDHKSSSCIFTDRNINLVNIESSKVTIQDIFFDCTLIRPDINAATDNSYHNKTVLNYDLSYSVRHASTYRVRAQGASEGLSTTGMGTNYIRYNSDDALAGDFAAAGEAYDTRHVGDIFQYGNIGHKIDPNNNTPPNETDTATAYADITMDRVKQAYRWEGGSMHKIGGIGTYIQDGACLNFEERNTPLFYLHCGTVMCDIGTGDHHDQIDTAATEAESLFPARQYSGAGAAHVQQLLWDIGDKTTVELWNRSARNLPTPIGTGGFVNRTMSPHSHYITGMWNSIDLTYKNQLIMHGKQGGNVPVISSALYNLFRDVDILHTVRTGFLKAPGGFDFENETAEQIGGALPLAPNLQAYMYPLGDPSGITRNVFSFAGTSSPSVRSSSIAFQAGADKTNDFFELAIEFNGVNTMTPSVFISCGNFKRVQMISYAGDTIGTGGIRSNIIDVTATNRIIRFSSISGARKIVFRFIGSNSGDGVYLPIHDIFALATAISQDKLAPFIQRGDAPIMASGDGTYYKLQAPPNGGGAATWVAL